MPQAVLTGRLSGDHLDHLAQLDLLREYYRQLIIRDAVSSVEVSDEDAEADIKTLTSKYGIVDEVGYTRFKSQHRVNDETFREHAVLKRRIRIFSSRRFKQEAEKLFVRQRSTFERIIFSMISVNDRGLAMEIYCRIEANEAGFPELASRFAVGPEKLSRGIVGPVTQAQLNRQLWTKIIHSTLLEVNEPFKLEGKWIVTRLEERLPAAYNDSLALQLSHRVFSEWVESQLSKVLSETTEQDNK